MSTSLNLGFHYHIPAIQERDRIRMPGYLGRFLDSLACHCRHLTCFLHSPLPHEVALLDYTLQSPNLTWVDLGVHASIPRRLLAARRVSHKVQSNLKALDLLLIRGSSPLLPVVASAAGNLPIALLLVGDNLAGVDDLKQPNWRRELIRAYWRWNKSQQTRVARRSLTFVNSQALYNELSDTIPNLRLTRTTTLSQDDFFERRDTCGAAPYRLLYTGRLDRAKGLLDMVEALALLVEQDEPVMLDLVGWPQAGDSILQEIERLAQARGVSGRVRYHGFQPLGPELFAFYKTADIYLIASQSSEGFPRTIWEAMAHSLPVVATRVGSIPDYVQDAAELVPPRQPEALAAGITRLIHDPSLRTARIAAGIRLARENTLESQTTRMCAEIESWLNTFN